MADGADPTQQDETQRIESLDSRFAKIETEQAEQRGILSQILEKASGTGQQGVDAAHDADEQAVDARLNRGSMIQDQMRQAIRDVQAEQQHAADHQAMRQQPAPEQQPREVLVRGKARLQKLMFGAD